jgi:hypothetical protein
MDKTKLEEIRVHCQQILIALGNVENLGGLGVSSSFRSGGLGITGHTFTYWPDLADEALSLLRQATVLDMLANV